MEPLRDDFVDDLLPSLAAVVRHFRACRLLTDHERTLRIRANNHVRYDQWSIRYEQM